MEKKNIIEIAAGTIRAIRAGEYTRMGVCTGDECGSGHIWSGSGLFQ